MNGKSRILILGGGLAGLSAGLVLTRAGWEVAVLERDPAVGGLAKTVVRGDFRFDLGGHRFYTANRAVQAFLHDLMGGELLTVPRKSRILLGGKYFDYPLTPMNAVCGLGAWTTIKVLSDYVTERVKNRLRAPRMVSLEDWVVSRFGRAMFRIYFREYSEKIWGVECGRISMEWVEQRIRGLSLGRAVKQALFKSGGGDIATLAEEFLYPPLGIGQIAEKMRDEIDRENRVLPNVRAERLEHNGSRVEGLTAMECGHARVFTGDEFVSTIPITSLIRMLAPKAPDTVLDAASKLRYRDLVIVAIMVDRARVTDQTWMYIPERKIPFSRIHEPTNWSARMAPEGKTLLVAEHFCFRGDDTWRARDEQLTDVTVTHLAGLGFVTEQEVIGSAVLRVPQAYPLFEVGYRTHYDRVCGYLNRFENLHITGRSGTFKYLNMDHAIASGIDAAEKVIERTAPARQEDRRELAIAGVNE